MSQSSTTSGDSLRSQIYQKLRRALRSGHWGSSRTATERDLAEQLGVSRTPVREALVLLLHDGLITGTSRGFCLPRWSQQDTAELFEIRRLLEPTALASTVDHLSTHVLRQLRESLRQQRSADQTGDVESFCASNSQFRASWLGAVPNTRMRWLIDLHDDHVQWLRRSTLKDSKVRKRVMAGLSRVLAALEAGDRVRAAAEMRAHLDAAEQSLSAAFADAREANNSGLGSRRSVAP